MSTGHEPLVPTLELVEQYVAGELPSAETERVAAYLATHESAAAALEVLRRSVDLAQNTVGDATQKWAQLVDRIEGLGLERGRSATSGCDMGQEKTQLRTGDIAIPASGRLLSTRAVPRYENSARYGVQRMYWLRSQTLRDGMGSLGSRTLRRGFWGLGAVVTVAVAVMVTIALLTYKTPMNTETTRTYTTQAGKQGTLTLVDGTRVTLAPRTTLRLVRFGASSRMVQLDGQAYFEVTRSSGTPFLVKTGKITTKVLGTAFLVRHYADERVVHVAVAEGRVSVASEAPKRLPVSLPVALSAGHVGDITDSTVIVNTVNDLTSEMEWLHGRLIFRQVTVGDVLQVLSRWYGYKFQCSDSMMTHKSVTLALNAQSSANALSTLEKVLRVRLTIVGDTVTLTPHAGRTSGTSRTQAYDIWIPTREVGR